MILYPYPHAVVGCRVQRTPVQNVPPSRIQRYKFPVIRVAGVRCIYIKILTYRGGTRSGRDGVCYSYPSGMHVGPCILKGTFCTTTGVTESMHLGPGQNTCTHGMHACIVLHECKMLPSKFRKSEQSTYG